VNEGGRKAEEVKMKINSNKQEKQNFGFQGVNFTARVNVEDLDGCYQRTNKNMLIRVGTDTGRTQVF
jgi:hypothetical protein